MLPTRILLASDRSEEAIRARHTAIELSEKVGAELHLVYVGRIPGLFYELPGFWELDMELPDMELLREMEVRAEEEAITRLEVEVHSLKEAGGKVAQAHAKVGRPDVEIVELAEELGADLIVIGSRGLGPLRKRALMGSVSESVLHHAHASVLVTRGEPISFPTKMLVSTDGSEEAGLAAGTAADIAGKTGSELHVVHVVELAPVYHPERHKYLAQYDRLREEAQISLDEQVEQIRAAGGIITQAHLRMGRPDVEIVVLSEEIGAGLIIVGSRGLGPLRRVLLGTVSGSVVRHAHRSVLVVREEKRRQ